MALQPSACSWQQAAVLAVAAFWCLCTSSSLVRIYLAQPDIPLCSTEMTIHMHQLRQVSVNWKQPL